MKKTQNFGEYYWELPDDQQWEVSTKTTIPCRVDVRVNVEGPGFCAKLRGQLSVKVCGGIWLEIDPLAQQIQNKIEAGIGQDVPWLFYDMPAKKN